MSINEVYGEFSKCSDSLRTSAILTSTGCGKTQLAHTMSVIAQIPKVVFLILDSITVTDLISGNGWGRRKGRLSW